MDGEENETFNVNVATLCNISLRSGRGNLNPNLIQIAKYQRTLLQPYIPWERAILESDTHTIKRKMKKSTARDTHMAQTES